MARRQVVATSDARAAARRFAPAGTRPRSANAARPAALPCRPVVLAAALALCGLPAASGRAQDEPPPPPPPGPRDAGAKEKFLDPADPAFRGALLGDVADFVNVGDERVCSAVGGITQPVWIRYDDFELRCDSAVLWGDRERLDAALQQRTTKTWKGEDDLLGNVLHAVYAEGHVHVRRGSHSFSADRALLDFRRHQAYIVNTVMEGEGKGRDGHSVTLGLRAAVVRGIGKDAYSAKDATLTSCTYQRPHLAFETSSVTVDFSKQKPMFETSWWPTLRADTPFGDSIPLLPLPKLGGSIGNQPIQNIEFATSSRFGTTLGLAFGGRIDREDGSTWGSWQAIPRIRTRRGVGLGLELDHEGEPSRPGAPADQFEIEIEYQRDTKREDSFSDLPFDGVAGGRSHPDRGLAGLRWRRHLDSDAERKLLGEGWRLDAVGSWYSDRGYLPEYEPDRAQHDPQQETYVALSRSSGNQAFALLGSYRLADETSALLASPEVTDYAISTDYLPSATWHLVNEPIVPFDATGFAPVNLSIEAHVSNADRRFEDEVADALRAGTGWRGRRVLREDLETRVTTPFELGPLQVTPAFGGSIYHVSDANGFANAGTSASGESQGRHSAFAGVRVGAEAHREYAVRDQVLDLDGLRHVVSADAQWFDRFRVSDDDPAEFQQNDLRDRLTEQNVVSLRLRNRLQTRREGEVVDWIDYEARFLWYASASDAVPGSRFGLREEFTTPLDRLDFPGEDKYSRIRRDGSAFHQHRLRVELLPELWFVGEADYDMTASQLESGAAGVRWFPDRRFSVYVGRRTIHDDSAIWTIRGDYRLSEKWGFTGEFQEDTRRDQGLRTRLALYRRSHDFTISIAFESERLLEETGFSILVYPHDWLARKGDPFSERRPLDFAALRWYR